MDLQGALNSYKKSKKGESLLGNGKMEFVTNNGKHTVERQPDVIVNENNYDAVDDMVFGAIPESQENDVKIYSARDEMKRLQAGLPTDISKCKLPKYILESIYEKPLIDTTQEDEINGFAQSVAKKAGVEKSAKIINELIERDKKAKEESERKAKSEKLSSGFDIDVLEDVIGDVIDKKIEDKIIPMIEKMVSGSTSINLIKESGEGKFLFLDSESNVYECTMKYKGKNKKKS